MHEEAEIEGRLRFGALRKRTSFVRGQLRRSPLREGFARLAPDLRAKGASPRGGRREERATL
jgi:hypothetical protein